MVKLYNITNSTERLCPIWSASTGLYPTNAGILINSILHNSHLTVIKKKEKKPGVFITVDAALLNMLLTGENFCFH